MLRARNQHAAALAIGAALFAAQGSAFAQQRETAPSGAGSTDGSKPAAETDVMADEWFKAAKPALELHGYYRVRSELFSHFALGRADDPRASLWPQPVDDDDSVTLDAAGNPVRRVTNLCGGDPLNPEPCESNLQAGANTRFRVMPELVISDNLRVVALVDLFDNLVLGSTPEFYSNLPKAGGGYAVKTRGGYVPIGGFAATQWAPSAGENSIVDSIVVKRAYGEYKSPIGTLRFGRQDSHWGLGMVENSSNGIDDDYGTVVDRLMFTAGLPQFDLYGSLMWDFGNEGATNALFLACEGSQECGQSQQQGQRYDVMQSDDLDQWGIRVYRQVNPDRAKLALSRGDVVLNGGFYGVYRKQTFDSRYALGDTPRELSPTLVRRGLESVQPDVWGQLLWGTLRVELEASMVWGGIENTDTQGGNNYSNPNSDNADDDGWDLRQFGFALEADWRAVEDRLRIGFATGFATGDDDVEGIAGFGGLDASRAPLGGLDAQLTRDRTFSTFRFHPDYRIDLILWRNILQRIQSAYYFRPSVEYDFLKSPSGQRFGGGASFVWSRASEFVQTPGNAEDLGFEIDGSLYYQAQGGTFSVDDDKMTGFFAKLQYGVLVPLPGLGYLPGEEARLAPEDRGLDIPQILRLYLGILY
ncbi:MAG: TIGR04551 family protein [Myxococcales bacterium]|nr:TIGR04551 family protein [Myxococcales bacterium]